MRLKKLIPLLSLMVFVLFTIPMLTQDSSIIFSTSEDLGLEDALIFYVIESHLSEQYDVDSIAFASTQFSIEALTQAESHFAVHSPSAVWIARANGAEVKTVGEVTGMDFVMVGTNEIEFCADWDGRSIAYNSEVGTSTVIGNYYFENICPDANPEVLYISGSSNRVAALLGGSLDAIVVHLDSTSVVFEEAPDEFAIVANFPEDFPWLVGSTLHVSTAFEEANPEAVQDVVTALIATLTEVNDDPSEFIEFSAELLGEDVEELADLIQTYVDAGLYRVDGWTLNNVEQSLAFFANRDDILGDLSMSDIVDFSYVEMAFDTLGIELDATDD